jgi:hypothetical protein
MKKAYYIVLGENPTIVFSTKKKAKGAAKKLNKSLRGHPRVCSPYVVYEAILDTKAAVKAEIELNLKDKKIALKDVARRQW